MTSAFAFVLLSCLLCVSTKWCGHDGDVCTFESNLSPAEQGSAMLQKQSTKKLTLLGADAEAIDDDANVHMDELPVTQEGFATMQNECCLLSFDLFTRNLLQSMGMEICDEGCHNGFIPFFYCGKSPSLQDFSEHVLSKSTEACPCYKPMGQCPPGGFPAECPQGIYNPVAHRRRTCLATTQEPSTVVLTTTIAITTTEAATTTTEAAPTTTEAPTTTTEAPTTTTQAATTATEAATTVIETTTVQMTTTTVAPTTTEAKATCDTFSCNGLTPLNKGSGVECASNAASCDSVTCCEAKATCDSYGGCTGATPVNKGSGVMCVSNAASCSSDTCCEAKATCDSYGSCSGATPVNKGSGVECASDSSSCDSNTCCEAQATCDTFTSCAGATPVNKGADVQCSGNSASCDVATCCQEKSTCPADHPFPYYNDYSQCCSVDKEKVYAPQGEQCDGSKFHAGDILSLCCDGTYVACSDPPCDVSPEQGSCENFAWCTGSTPLNKGSSVQCSGNALTCDSNTCCEARATCQSFTSCSGNTPVNKGSTVQCSGNAASCDSSTCCEAKATCDSYSGCTGATPVNKGSGVMCTSNAASCSSATCCEARATCDSYSGCTGATPVNKGSGVMCASTAASCSSATCCEAAAETCPGPANDYSTAGWKWDGECHQDSDGNGIHVLMETANDPVQCARACQKASSGSTGCCYWKLKPKAGNPGPVNIQWGGTCKWYAGITYPANPGAGGRWVNICKEGVCCEHGGPEV